MNCVEKINILITMSIIMILSFLPACTRDLTVVSESPSIQPETEQPESIYKSTGSLSSITSSSNNTSTIEEAVYPWLTSEHKRRFWLPDGKYFVEVSKKGVNFYNTDNELEKQKHFSLPEKLFLSPESGNNYDILPTNSGFYYVQSFLHQSDEEERILWKKGDEYILTSLVYMDWSGNILIQRPDVEVRTDEQGEKKFYLDNVEVQPAPFEIICTLLDEDLLLLKLSHISHTQIKDYFIHYIPSQNKFIDLGWHDVNDWSIKTPRGIVWKDSPNLYLTTGETTIQLFKGIDVQHFFVSDEIIVVSQKEFFTGEGYLTPLYYASWKDLELKEIGGTYSDVVQSYYLMREANMPPNYQLMMEGPYIVYDHYQDGLIVYDTRTDETWKIREDWASLEDFRIKNGEWEVILYGKGSKPDSYSEPMGNPEMGYFVVTKDKTTYYPKDYEGHKYEINPQRTRYIYLSEDYSIFSIRPCVPVPEGDESFHEKRIPPNWNKPDSKFSNCLHPRPWGCFGKQYTIGSRADNAGKKTIFTKQLNEADSIFSKQ